MKCIDRRPLRHKIMSDHWDDLEYVDRKVMPEPLHFDRAHFTAITAQGRKFVYCPVGNICSWSEGDHTHKWCHYCKKFFGEIGA